MDRWGLIIFYFQGGGERISDGMRDEDSEDLVVCPYCGRSEDCPHLLAVIDKTFNECSDGYAYGRYREFHEAIEKSFGGLLKKRGAGRYQVGQQGFKGVVQLCSKGLLP